MKVLLLFIITLVLSSSLALAAEIPDGVTDVLIGTNFGGTPVQNVDGTTLHLGCVGSHGGTDNNIYNTHQTNEQNVATGGQPDTHTK